MTLYGLLASLAWSGVALYAARRAGDLLTMRQSTGKDENVPMPVVGPSKRLPEKNEVPDDLIAVANQESEEWARDDVIQDIRLKYATLGDWQKVRRAIGIGELP